VHEPRGGSKKRPKQKIDANSGLGEAYRMKEMIRGEAKLKLRRWFLY